MYYVMMIHRCGAGGSMRACHAAGLDSIPGRDVSWVRIFRVFFPHKVPGYHLAVIIIL